VTARLVLGDFTGHQMRVLGDLADAYGDGQVRVTINQDLVFRWVRNDDVPELYRRLAAAGMGKAGADTIADGVSCPGAESCRLAAKIPARRVTDAVERLLKLYEKEKQDSETATDYFARVDVNHARAAVADLEAMTPETAKPEDYVDLGEDHEYKVEILDGECS